jgi:two-component system nitrate/nitrite response regulator NarL
VDPLVVTGAASLRVMVVDDHPVVLDGVRMLVRTDARIAIVASAATVREALEAMRAAQPDVVLLDLRLPDMLAPEAVHRLRAAHPRTKIVIFTAYPEHAALDDTLDAGVDGCLLKDAATEDLVGALWRVHAGVRVVDARLPQAGGAACAAACTRWG